MKYLRTQDVETPDLENLVAKIPDAKLTRIYKVSGIGEFIDSADSFDPTYTRRLGTFGYVESLDAKLQIENEHPDYIFESVQVLKVGNNFYFFWCDKMIDERYNH